jgi:hypothetical protein
MAHTASGALHFGIDEATLAAVRDYQVSQLFNAAERAAFTFAVAASSNPNRVNDAIFAELRGHWSEEQIAELAGVIAMAGFLSRWNVSMATPIEEGSCFGACSCPIQKPSHSCDRAKKRRRQAVVAVTKPPKDRPFLVPCN